MTTFSPTRHDAALPRSIGRHAELAERLHQAEAGGLVVGERKAADHDALVGGEPDRARLGDEVADGEHQAVVADDDAVAGALGAEDLRGERVLRESRRAAARPRRARRRGRSASLRAAGASRPETPSRLLLPYEIPNASLLESRRRLAASKRCACVGLRREEDALARARRSSGRGSSRVSVWSADLHEELGLGAHRLDHHDLRRRCRALAELEVLRAGCRTSRAGRRLRLRRRTASARRAPRPRRFAHTPSKTFIAGEPMNCATNRFAGRS